MTLEIECSQPPTEGQLIDAIYRTMARNSRLCCYVSQESNIACPLGQTLGELKPKYTIKQVPADIGIPDLEESMTKSLNEFFPRDKLGWAIRIFTTNEPMKGAHNSPRYNIHLGLTMLHLLTDGFGLVKISEQYAISLEEAMSASSPLSLDTSIPPHSPIGDDYQSVLTGKSILDFKGAFLFLWLARAVVGLYYILQMVIGLIFILPFTRPWSGTKDPKESLKFDDNGLPSVQTSGYRLMKFTKEEVDNLRVSARAAKGTVSSLLTIAGLAAYNSVSERYQKPLKKYSFLVPMNTRPLINDLSIFPLIHGCCTHLSTVFNYSFSDYDSFWKHVERYKKSLHFEFIHLSPVVKILNVLVPSWLGATIFERNTVHHKRKMPLMISNVGNLKGEQLQWSEKIKVTDIVGSSNSFWNGNTSLFQVTAITLDGRMNLAIIYPPYLVEELDADLFCESLRSILSRVLHDPFISVGTARSQLPLLNNKIKHD